MFQFIRTGPWLWQLATLDEGTIGTPGKRPCSKLGFAGAAEGR